MHGLCCFAKNTSGKQGCFTDDSYASAAAACTHWGVLIVSLPPLSLATMKGPQRHYILDRSAGEAHATRILVLNPNSSLCVYEAASGVKSRSWVFKIRGEAWGS